MGKKGLENIAPLCQAAGRQNVVSRNRYVMAGQHLEDLGFSFFGMGKFPQLIVGLFRGSIRLSLAQLP